MTIVKGISRSSSILGNSLYCGGAIGSNFSFEIAVLIYIGASFSKVSYLTISLTWSLTKSVGTLPFLKPLISKSLE